MGAAAPLVGFNALSMARRNLFWASLPLICLNVPITGFTASNVKFFVLELNVLLERISLDIIVLTQLIN